MPHQDYACVFYYDKKTNNEPCDEDFSCIVTYNTEDKKMRIYERKLFDCLGNLRPGSVLTEQLEEYEIRAIFINSPYNVRFEFKSENQDSDKFFVYYVIENVVKELPRCLTEDITPLTTKKSNLGSLESIVQDASMCFNMVDLCEPIICQVSNYYLTNGNELKTDNTAYYKSLIFPLKCVIERNDIGFSEMLHNKYVDYAFQLKAQFHAMPIKTPCHCGNFYMNFNGCCYNEYRQCFCCPSLIDYDIQLSRKHPKEGINCVKDINEQTMFKDEFIRNKNVHYFYYDFFTTTCPSDLNNYRIPRHKLRDGMRIPIVSGEYLERVEDTNIEESLKVSKLDSWPGIKGCVLLVPKDFKGERKYQVFSCTSENSQYENFEFNNKSYGAIKFSFKIDINQTTSGFDKIDSKYFVNENVPITTKEEETTTEIEKEVKTEESIVKNNIETEDSINKKIKENSDLLDLINKKIHYIESHINRTVEDKSEQEALEKINKDIKSIEKNLQEELKRTNELSSKAMEKNKEEIFDTYNKIHNELIEIKEKVKKEEKVISKNESDKRSYSGNILISNNTLHINKDDDLKYRVKNDYHFSNNNFYWSNSHHHNISNEKEITNDGNFVIEKDSDMRKTENVTNSVQSDNVEIKNTTEDSEINKELADDLNKATIFKLEEDDCIKKENVNKIVDGNMNFGKSVIGGGAFMDLDDYQYKDYVLSQTTEGENYTENYCFLSSRQCPDYSNETLLTSSSSGIHRNYSAGGIMLLIILFYILKRIFIK